MKRYDGYILRFINHEGGAREQEPAEVYLADETDKTIMNMVNEFAETAKEYEAELAKKDEEIARLIESYNKAVDPLEDDVKRQKEEIARLRKALEWYRCNSLNGGEKAIEALERGSP